MATQDNTFFLVNIGSEAKPNVYTKISPEDAQLTLMYKWRATKSASGGYYVATVDRTAKPLKTLRLSRLILNAPDGTHVDHKNGDTLDNRRENLRIATPQQNQANSQKHIKKSSIYKGVSWHKDACKWRVYIVFNRKQEALGLFSDELEAARAYDKRAEELFGEFARLNLE